MLNNDSINQLSQLKKNIQASKEYGEGTVVGSQGRFGFVKLEDGRDAFLSPDKMQHTIPGDIVRVSLKKNNKGKLEADLEALITASLDRFVGQYRIKNGAHFIQPGGQQSTRWIFVPPKSRGKCKEGDFVVAKLTHHPFDNGKPSAKVLERIGKSEDTKFELKYVKAKFALNYSEHPAVATETRKIEERFEQQDFGERADLSHLEFVTIDAATTKDMDDALAVEPCNDDTGNQILHVAIADPSSFIAQNSAIAKTSLKQGQTVYLLGGAIPMLPLPLSHHCFSLEPNKKRPALVAHLTVSSEGEVESSSLEFAVIESKFKLAYEDAARFLDGADNNAVPEGAQATLSSLKSLATARRQYREARFLLMQDQTDYDYRLGDNGHIEDILPRPRNIAHQIVEEAMIATNICGAELLKKHSGIFVTHKGIRTDRLGEAKALLKEEGIAHGDLTSLEGHLTLFKTLENDPDKSRFTAPLRRMMENVELSDKTAPHLGMGFPAYATITSPIRRYADLYNHWCLRQVLAQDEGIYKLSEEALLGLRESLSNGRQADRELSQWLITTYAKQLVGQKAAGKIRIVTQHGFGVRLDDNGIEGFVLFPKNQEKKYDAKRMTLGIGEEQYFIGKPVSIKVKSIDEDKRRIAFELANDNE